MNEGAVSVVVSLCMCIVKSFGVAGKKSHTTISLTQTVRACAWTRSGFTCEKDDDGTGPALPYPTPRPV